ncbi:MAG: flavodoxin [Clostridiales bacterium]|nr:MAG: flavodoxin [Clostridiales bacterium]
MKKLVIIYWSGTGNTEMMAEAIAEGASARGADVEIKKVEHATIDDVENADVVALGCPSMGNEVLEESEMEPFVEDIEVVSNGKNMVLFGSYGWGQGEWMEDWKDRMESCGANLVAECLIINETPDNDGLEKCRDLGAEIV